MADIKKGSSETIRALCTSHIAPQDGKSERSEICEQKISNTNTLSQGRYSDKKNPELFKHWFAGLIDADGCLLVSKAGYTSCEITVGEKEFALLALVKKHVGGKIKKRGNLKAYRWRSHNKTGILHLLEMIDGKLLLRKRVEQFQSVSKQLDLTTTPLQSCLEGMQELHVLRQKHTFSSDNAWLAGFFEGEGYFRVNQKTLQLGITLSQKDQRLLQEIAKEMGGSICYDKSCNGWLYSASSRQDIAKWISYFSRFPLISWKQIQLFRFKKILLYKSRGVHLSKEGKSWLRFKRLVSNFKS